MRIVHLGKYYSPFKGGMETHVETIAKHQAKQGHEVHVLGVNDIENPRSSLSRFRYTADRAFVDADVNVHLMGRYTKISKLDIVRKVRRVVNSIAESQTTVVHLHTPNPTFSLNLISLPFIKNLVVSHHSDMIGQGMLSYVFEHIENLVYARSKLIISDSEQYISGSRLLSKYRSKTRVLPLGIELAPFSCPSPEAQQLASGIREKYPNPIWLSVGRICKYKGLETAVRALTKIGGTLIIVGTGPVEAELKALSRKLGVEERICWFGEADNVTLVAAYHAAKALWFTSNARNEGFGQVQVEAMACSTPVINTHIENSGVDWVSLSDESGLTIPPNCHTSLVEASNRLASDESLYRRLSHGASRRAEELFNASDMARQSTMLYDQYCNVCS